MAGELPRRIRRRFFRNRTAGRLAAHHLDQVAKLFPGHRPLTQQFQRGLALLVKHRTHNRAFQPLGTGSGIQNHFNTAPQFLLHGRGGSRADMAEAIGAGRSYRTPQRFRHPPHGRMSAYANGHRRKAAGYNIRNDIRLWQHQGQRPRPESGGKRMHQIFQPLRNGGIFFHLTPMMHMNNQRIKRRPSLGFKNPCYRFRVQGICPQAVYSLRGNPYQRSRTQSFRRTGIQFAVV